MMLKIEVDLDVMQTERPLWDVLHQALSEVGTAAAEPGAIEGLVYCERFSYGRPKAAKGPVAGKWWIE